MRKLPINIQIVFNTQDDEYDELMKDCKEFAKGIVGAWFEGAGWTEEEIKELKPRVKVEFVDKNQQLKNLRERLDNQKINKVAEAISKKDYDSIYNEYKLAITANNQLAGKLSESEKKVKDLQLQLFAFVRNSCVAPVGLKLKKTQQEITDKTFETIREAQKIIDSGKMRAFMNLATNKEDRYDN